jgi:hypothetical protein
MESGDRHLALRTRHRASSSLQTYTQIKRTFSLFFRFS